MPDYLAFLRKADEVNRLERQEWEAQRAAKAAVDQQYRDAWNAVFETLEAADKNPEVMPDMSRFITLARVLKKWERDIWFKDMAIIAAASIDDVYHYRPAQLFFIQLMMLAGERGATAKKLLAKYQSFVPSHPPHSWRHGGANDVFDFLVVRIANAPREKQILEESNAAKAAEKRAALLRKAAGRRPALEKQLFAVHWHGNGLRPAQIRDKWEEAHPHELPKDRVAARKDIRIAMTRGQAFIAKHKTTIQEVAELLGISF